MTRADSSFKRRGKPFWLSVRFRLTLWYVALFGLALFVFGAAVYVFEIRRADVALQSQLQSDARDLTNTYNLKDGHLHPEQLPSDRPILVDKRDLVLLVSPEGAIQQWLGRPSEKDIGQLWLIGKSLAIGPKRFTDYDRGDPASGQSESTRYGVFASPIQQKDQTVAWLVMAIPLTSSPEASGLLIALLGAGAATLLASAGGGYWLAVRAMRPVRLITQTAAVIGETDLSHRLRLHTADELGELADTFDRMLDRLQAAFDRERQFTGDASHELRTPLAIINLEVTRALAELRSPTEYRRVLEIVRSENEFMARVVNGLLTLARADAGQVRLSPEAIDLGDLALEVVERLTPLGQRNGIRLETNDLSEIVVAGDRVLLTQLLTNLIENAIKYASGAGSRARISVGETLECGERRAWVRVEDDGPGISAEHLPHIFDRFYRVDRARGFRASDLPSPDPGTPTADEARSSGLGLAICRWIALAHDGEIHVESVLGRGSAFEVRLPMLAGSALVNPPAQSYR